MRLTCLDLTYLQFVEFDLSSRLWSKEMGWEGEMWAAGKGGWISGWRLRMDLKAASYWEMEVGRRLPVTLFSRRLVLKDIYSIWPTSNLEARRMNALYHI